MITLKQTENKVMIDGLLYKVGLRGMVFVFADGGWFRSQKEPRDIQRAINERNEKINGLKEA